MECKRNAKWYRQPHFSVYGIKEQKKMEWSGSAAVGGLDQLEAVQQILCNLDHCWSERGEFPASLQQSLIGSEGLRLLAAAVTILLTDYGGTTPAATCAAIAEETPQLFDAFGEEHVLAVCEEIQHSEMPSQSALLQEMLQRFNTQYFAGRLPDYRILVVYDVWHWATEQYGYEPEFPPAAESCGFIDFPARQIFIRFLGYHSIGSTMAETLIHEMAHAATDGNHDANWQAEMTRLKRHGAPVSDVDF
jgi:hypothetical protein